MGFSIETNEIIQALREIAQEYCFVFRTERLVFPQRGRRSERVDVVFDLPSGRSVLWFEIDNHPDRAAHNRLKIFGDVLALSTIPVVSLAVHHGRAGSVPHAYPIELLQSGFVLPPRFLDTVTVDNSSFDAIAADLRQWLHKLVTDLATAPEWGTVFGITEQYQPLVRNLSLHVAAAHLEVHSELAWFLFAKGRVPAERAACLSTALARMLQRAGYHADAKRYVKQLRGRVPDPSVLSADTNDDATAVELLLNLPDFKSDASLKHLSLADIRLQENYNRSKFLWRQAIPHFLAGNAHDAESVIALYLRSMDGSLAADSNIALLRTLGCVTRGTGDPREHAEKYSQHERYMLTSNQGPDGTVHGVVTSLYLKLVSESVCGNKDAVRLFPRLDAFCNGIGLPRTADGLREINCVLPEPIKLVAREMQPEETETLSSLLKRGRTQTLDELCARVDLICS